MSNKTVLLARPNLFIVKEMQKLMADCQFNPVKLETAEQLSGYSGVKLGGAVISTGLHSPVKKNFAEMVKLVHEQLPNTPILLASMIDFNSMKRSIELGLSQQGIDAQLLSIEDASKRTSIDTKKELVVIQKKDITDTAKYALTQKTVGRFFA